MKRKLVVLLFFLCAASAIALPKLGDRGPVPDVAKPTFDLPAYPAHSRTEPFPEQYRVLLTRSIFVRGGGAGAAAELAAHAGKAAGQEGNLAFRGVTVEDGQFVAFVEDTAGGGVRQYHAGEPIASGLVSSITLDLLAYDSGGKTAKIRVGQNLTGAQLPPASQPSKPPGGEKGAPGGPKPKGKGPPGAPGEGEPPPGGPKPGGKGSPGRQSPVVDSD